MSTIITELTEMELEMILNAIDYQHSNDGTMDRDYRARLDDLRQELDRLYQI